MTKFREASARLTERAGILLSLEYLNPASNWENALTVAHALGLVELARNFPGFENLSENELAAFARLLVPIKGYNESCVYVARIPREKRVVAALEVRTIKPKQENGFWQTLTQRKIPPGSRDDKHVLTIDGIVTTPDLRRRGLQKELLTAMVAEKDPSVVFGHSQVPEAVMLGARVFSEHGYRTFYGETEVTPNEIVGESVNLGVLQEAYANYRGDTCIGVGIIMAETPYLSKKVSNTSGFPPHIQKAFEPLQIVQQAQEGKKGATQMLISIKAEDVKLI